MSRIYVVSTTIHEPPPVGAPEEEAGLSTTTFRLVKADNPSQARNYVTKDAISVRYAEQDAIVSMLSNGIKVEDATDPLASQPTLPGV
jgi:hypothetical protein